MNIKLKFEGYLKGGYPIDEEAIDLILELDFYNDLIDLISNNKDKEAIDLASKYFEAEYIISNLSILEEKGFEFIENEDIFLNGPFIEELNGVKIPLFRWIGAGFILEGPKEIISKWMIKNQSGYYEFDEDIFNNWLDEFGDGDCLQDGCGYNLAGACYDLEGFGSNGCSIDKEFIEDSFNN